jgi:hypothetical protein
VVADLETKDARVAVQEALKKLFANAKPADVVPRSLKELRETSAILDAKAPADAQAFKAFLNAIAKKVAEATKEGGFLGFGGVQVSDAEKATLAQIAEALGTSATA